MSRTWKTIPMRVLEAKAVACGDVDILLHSDKCYTPCSTTVHAFEASQAKEIHAFLQDLEAMKTSLPEGFSLSWDVHKYALDFSECPLFSGDKKMVEITITLSYPEVSVLSENDYDPRYVTHGYKDTRNGKTYPIAGNVYRFSRRDKRFSRAWACHCNWCVPPRTPERKRVKQQLRALRNIPVGDIMDDDY